MSKRIAVPELIRLRERMAIAQGIRADTLKALGQDESVFLWTDQNIVDYINKLIGESS